MKPRLAIFPVVFGIGLLISLVSWALDFGPVGRYVFYACAAAPTIWIASFVAFRGAKSAVPIPQNSKRLGEVSVIRAFSMAWIQEFGVEMSAEPPRHWLLRQAVSWLVKVAGLLFIGLAVWGAVAGRTGVLIAATVFAAATALHVVLHGLYFRVGRWEARGRSSDGTRRGPGEDDQS